MRIKNEKYKNLNLKWLTSAFKYTTNDVKMVLDKSIFFLISGKEKAKQRMSNLKKPEL